ncbi:MAG: nitroreductase [Chloroflexi bacterium]|nr:nitroreductase [Chloroflexota bacterium]
MRKMDVIEAIKARYSVRAYKPEPVPKEVLTELMETALRAPSWANTQSWEFAIVGGQVMRELEEVLGAKAAAQDERYPDIPRPEWPSPYQERRRELGNQIYRLMGIGRDDMDKQLQWFVHMYRFFDAPNAIIVYTNRGLSEWALLNIGLIVQSIALAAVNYGLGTTILASSVSYPDEIKHLLNIPDTKQLVLAIAIGYLDLEAKVNKFRSNRVPLDSVVTWHGF